MSKMWMVRAGEGAFLIDKFKEENLVAIGWEIGNLSNIKSSEDIKELIRQTYPDKKEGQINNIAGQVSKFRFELKKGDKVVSYDPQNRVYLVGEIDSDYIYNDDFYDVNEEYSDIRKVKWLGEVKRDDLSTSTRNTLGAIMTIFNVNKEATRDILSVLHGKKRITEDEEEEKVEEDIIKEDIVAKSHEFIKDRILALDWDEMQELVAGLLRGMGYKTIVSSRGPDRGRDIFASPDGLGFKDPRIIVEVKHRKGQMGSQEIRKLNGGLRKDDKGLYVSTGGFTKDARYEADRSDKPMTLIDADTLISLIIQYYIILILILEL
jgi:Uncharacterized conserved protein